MWGQSVLKVGLKCAKCEEESALKVGLKCAKCEVKVWLTGDMIDSF